MNPDTSGLAGARAGGAAEMLRAASTRSMLFFEQYLLRPGRTGAVLPSSRALAREMVAWLELDTARTVLEFGPGTGAFTKALLPKLRSECRLILIELNPDFVKVLNRNFPAVKVYNDSVANARAICDREDIDKVDCIVSGLPWAGFPQALQESCLCAIKNVLRPGGQFVTFAYRGVDMLPRARRFRESLDKCFREVSTSKTITWNVPPAHVYRCRL